MYYERINWIFKLESALHKMTIKSHKENPSGRMLGVWNKVETQEMSVSKLVLKRIKRRRKHKNIKWYHEVWGSIRYDRWQMKTFLMLERPQNPSEYIWAGNCLNCERSPGFPNVHFHSLQRKHISPYTTNLNCGLNIVTFKVLWNLKPSLLA